MLVTCLILNPIPSADILNIKQGPSGEIIYPLAMCFSLPACPHRSFSSIQPPFHSLIVLICQQKHAIILQIGSEVHPCKSYSTCFVFVCLPLVSLENLSNVHQYNIHDLPIDIRCKFQRKLSRQIVLRKVIRRLVSCWRANLYCSLYHDNFTSWQDWAELIWANK